ncbi:FAD:protein FMN transferase [Oscillibacter sp. ER4]|uniref:FAD:protein FMN transferase n=1 Tax=Oscillibacter sp. ER4 TaxID=1519439 RepID=UPI00051BA86D|nr:FAD:protein FMN transferase [Oscillibacter sp. ER4]
MKRQLAALLLTIFALSLTACGETAAESETRTVYAMDTVMNLTVYGENAAAALESAEKELHTLDEAVLSRTAEGSELYALNASNGETVECGADDILPALIETALAISEATDGAFDPTLAPVLDAWGFTKDLRRVPSADELAALLAHTGRDKVALEETADGYSVALSDGAQLDLGGIAKGYAADLLRAQLEKEGVTSATLDLGGDVFVMGKKSDGSDWRIAVKDPGDTESYLGIVSASDAFIVTSGVYERYFEENGVRYHHILDPKTGSPAESGLVSVTVMCKNGAWADALSTACFVLGADGALALRDDLAAQGTNFELIFVTDDGRVLYTGGLAAAFTPNEESGYTYESLA